LHLGSGSRSIALDLVILQAMESRKLLLLYGSETGCAQDTAERIGRQARRRHFKARVIAMDEYDRVRSVLFIGIRRIHQ
jgi:sulfite reductase alpha subunit-like flavoprotein